MWPPTALHVGRKKAHAGGQKVETVGGVESQAKIFPPHPSSLQPHVI